MARIAVVLWLVLAGIVAAQQAPQFTGKSDVMDGKDLTAARRHFDAGARTYWHSHANGQLLPIERGNTLAATSSMTRSASPELTPGAALPLMAAVR